MPLTLPPITLALLSLLAFSVYLLRRSLRGRPLGDHPTCSRCSFDLFNRPETSTRCPECGSDLTAPRAILTGARRRNPAFVLASLTLLLLTLASSLTLTYRLITDPRLIPFQPTFVLPLHFRYGPLAAPALAELQSRIVTGQAPASSASGVIGHILFRQSNPKVLWNPTHGDFIETLHAFSLLPAADWTTYLKQCATFTARIRPNIRTGDPVPLELALTTRVGARRTLTGTFTIDVTFDDQPARPPRSPGRRGPSRLSSYTSLVRHTLLPVTYASLTPGPHTAHVSTTFYSGPPDDPLEAHRQSFDLPFTLHPADHPTVHILDEPDLREQVARAIRVDVGVTDYISADPMFQIRAPNSPCALSYDVIIRSGTKELGRNSFTIDKGSPSPSRVSPTFLDRLPTHVDIILRPNPDPAAETVDITEICAGDIVLPNIPTTPTRGFAPTPMLPTTRP